MNQSQALQSRLVQIEKAMGETSAQYFQAQEMLTEARKNMTALKAVMGEVKTALEMVQTLEKQVAESEVNPEPEIG